MMPLTAFLGRLFGQKRVYMTALALFVADSALCGMARSLPMMVLFRVIQGLGAGALQPTEQAILRQTFPPKEHGMAMAFFGARAGVRPDAGRLDRRQLLLALDLLHQPADRLPRAIHGVALRP